MKYRKEPIIIEAIQYLGTSKSFGETNDFTNDGVYVNNDNIFIKTLEGNMVISVNDYVIKGIQGEFYPCKPDIFEATYEAV